MTCYHPLKAYEYIEDGARRVVFSLSKARQHAYIPLELPCGKCIGCQLDKSVDTAVRAVHESLCWEHNCFITLTVDDLHMDEIFPNRSLCKRPFQLFAKRLRKLTDNKIRILWCGEYGSDHYRPHYHALIFNYDFDDKYFWQSQNGVVTYRSSTLEKLWPYGFCTVGDVTFNSAAYIARYVTKKLFVNDHSSPEIRERYNDKYMYVDPVTGEIKERLKEFIEYPRGFGLGKLYYDQHEMDIYDKTRLESACRVLKRGEVKSFKVPKYYDKKEVDKDEAFMKDLKRKRRSLMKEHRDEYTPERLEVMEQLAEYRVNNYLKRNL